MSNGKPWTEAHTATLKAWGGKIPDARIAGITGHSVRTIRERRRDAGIQAHVGRTAWSRRDWLLHDAAGLEFALVD